MEKKEKKRKNNAFGRKLDDEPGIILGCPGPCFSTAAYPSTISRADTPSHGVRPWSQQHL